MSQLLRVGWFTSCSFLGKSHCFSESGALWMPIRELVWFLLVSFLPSSTILATSTGALALLHHSGHLQEEAEGSSFVLFLP